MNDYVAYTRPRSIPVTLAMALTGWLASPSRPHPIHDVSYLVVVHSFLLWGGTNAFNSAEDRDTGPVNLMPDPPPRPKHLRAFGLALMLTAIAVSILTVPLVATVLIAIAVLLSIFYSWRGASWRRGKDIPGVDNLINAAGCGVGSFTLGWVTTGAPLSSHAIYLGLAWTVCLFGGMPTAQIFQIPDETRPSWASWLGPSRVLRVGATLFVLHLVLLARVTHWSALTTIWAVGIALAALHSLAWSRTPLVHAYPRMLRQMTLLTVAQLCWAVGLARG